TTSAGLSSDASSFPPSLAEGEGKDGVADCTIEGGFAFRPLRSRAVAAPIRASSGALHCERASSRLRSNRAILASSAMWRDRFQTATAAAPISTPIKTRAIARIDGSVARAFRSQKMLAFGSNVFEGGSNDRNSSAQKPAKG